MNTSEGIIKQKMHLKQSIKNKNSIRDNLIKNFHPEKKEFYYKPLPIRKVSEELTCPVCGETFKEQYLWQHIAYQIHEQKHREFFIQQLQFCAELFFNVWYYGDQYIEGCYFSYKFAKKNWKIWFKEIKISKRISSIHWNLLAKDSHYDENFTFDFSSNICPICGENIIAHNGKNELEHHLSNNWYKEDHYHVWIKLIGDILHRKEWDESCYYDYDFYKNALYGIYGKSYSVKKKIKPQTPRKKLSKALKNKQCKIEFKKDEFGKSICPICKQSFFKQIIGHIKQKFNDKAHYDFLVAMHDNMDLSKYYKSNTTSKNLPKRKEFKYIKKVKQIENSVDWSKKKFICQKPQISEYDEAKLHICPVCGKNVKNWSIWQHAMTCVDTHKDFIKQQLQLCANLFFNVWYQKNVFVKNCYISFNTMNGLYWKEHLSQFQQDKQEIHIKVWELFANESYYNDAMYFDYICPACGENCLDISGKNHIINHLKINFRDTNHQNIIKQIIGDALHREKWDDTCCYSENTFYEILEQIKGEEYANSMQEDLVSSCGARGYRSDLGFSVNSSWEANVYRIFKYELGNKWNWKRGIDYEIPFDISTQERTKIYYVDIYDTFGILKKDHYIEIKGVYNEDAKYKKEKFMKLHSKNYIMIGIPNDDFQPEINYLDLYLKYRDVIPEWEKFGTKFTPERNDVGGYRRDIDSYANNFWEANLFRIFQYEYGNTWKDLIDINVKFDVSLPYKKKTYYAKIYDKGNLFNGYIEIQKDLKAFTRFNISIAKERNPNKKFIVIGNKPYDDIQYYDLESKYKNLIPLWETNDHNLNTNPDLYTEKQTIHVSDDFILNKINKIPLCFNHRAKPSKYIFTISNICPICKKPFKDSFHNHVIHDYLQHRNFIDDQFQLIYELFWDINYYSDDDNDSYHLYFPMSKCKEYWKQLFPQELFQERLKLAYLKHTSNS